MKKKKEIALKEKHVSELHGNGNNQNPHTNTKWLKMEEVSRLRARKPWLKSVLMLWRWKWKRKRKGGVAEARGGL